MLLVRPVMTVTCPSCTAPQVVGEEEKKAGTVNVRTRDNHVRFLCRLSWRCRRRASFRHLAAKHLNMHKMPADSACRVVCFLPQVHGMHSVDAVAEKLAAEIGSRSKTSGFAAAAADQQQSAPAQDGAAASNGPAGTAQG